jgi:hypothetical protein
MGDVNRLWKIILAETRCNIYCLWKLCLYNNPVCEFKKYDNKNRLILIATTKDSLWGHYVEGKPFNIDKIFYSE